MKWNHEINRPESYQEAVDWFNESQAENTRLLGLLREVGEWYNKCTYVDHPEVQAILVRFDRYWGLHSPKPVTLEAENTHLLGLLGEIRDIHKQYESWNDPSGHLSEITDDVRAILDRITPTEGEKDA